MEKTEEPDRLGQHENYKPPPANTHRQLSQRFAVGPNKTEGNERNKLAELAYDPLFGARPLKRVMQKTIINELSRLLIAGKIEADQEIMLVLEGDELVFRNAAAEKQNV